MRIQKPRAYQGLKDMALTLGVLAVVMFFTVAFTGLCSFRPGGAEHSGPVNEVDISTVLRMDAAGLNFPIRQPEMPENWVPNSARRVQVGKFPSSLVGWVIDGSSYISLTQTNAPYKDAIEPDDAFREESGTREIGGAQWHIFTGDKVRPIWVADAGDVRFILEGMASDEMMATAAQRTMSAPVISRK